MPVASNQSEAESIYTLLAIAHVSISEVPTMLGHARPPKPRRQRHRPLAVSEVRDALEICLAALRRLEDQDQRVTVACSMVAVKSGELKRPEQQLQ
jgi:hypothetical protein